MQTIERIQADRSRLLDKALVGFHRQEMRKREQVDGLLLRVGVSLLKRVGVDYRDTVDDVHVGKQRNRTEVRHKKAQHADSDGADMSVVESHLKFGSPAFRPFLW